MTRPEGQRAILKFFGGFRWLSNFYPSPFTDVNGTEWPTVEHYYQAMKCVLLDDAMKIHDAVRPGLAKQLGRRVALRPDWEDVKNDVMLGGLRAKFASGSELAALLVGTGSCVLVEGNEWHDQYWGDCCCGQPSCVQPGLNVLGGLLERVRDELRGR